MPVLFGRDGNLGILIAFAMVPIAYFLLYRTTLGFEIRTVGANPSAARYAGMSPRRLIILTMSLCGLFAGLAGAIEILSLGYYPAVFGTTIGFAGITVALLGRAHPVGIVLAALLLGGMRAGAPADADRSRHPDRDHRRHPGPDPAVPRRRNGDPARVPDPRRDGHAG